MRPYFIDEYPPHPASRGDASSVMRTESQRRRQKCAPRTHCANRGEQIGDQAPLQYVTRCAHVQRPIDIGWLGGLAPENDLDCRPTLMDLLGKRKTSPG